MILISQKFSQNFNLLPSPICLRVLSITEFRLTLESWPKQKRLVFAPGLVNLKKIGQI